MALISNELNGKLHVRVGEYLKKIKEIEKSKPQNERLSVPTFKELSEVAGVAASNISRVANGHIKSLNLEIAASIITEMRRRGFDTEITDILKFEMPGESKPTRRIPPPLTRRQRLKYPGEEFVNAYAEALEDEAECADASPIQPEMQPGVAEVVRMLTSFPEPIQKNTVEALKAQLELVQKTLSFQDQSLQK